MKTPQPKKKPVDEPSDAVHVAGAAHHPIVHEAGGAAGGALAGAALGAIGGPAGAAVGAVLGGVVGAFVAKVSDEEAARVSFHDHELDAEIGVEGGDIGAPGLKHPPAVRGTYSAASAGGGGGGGGGSADGPMPTPEK
ncbi:MAG TPA: glycine zipper domain-containing protein [Labilithrix sp.]|nr:glycine zipper domain-containing protein [Labilithrix sp.]